MSFKKLNPEVVIALERIDIKELEGDAKTFFSAIKSGKNLIINAPVSSGKTTAALVSIFNKVHQEFEGSPRAIYLTDTIEKAEIFQKKTAVVCRKLDITSDLVHDKGNMVQQRNDIFDGTEIIVGNPKRMFELYLQNGVNIKLLDLFIIDDFELCISSNKQAEIKRLIESLENKTQLVLMTNTLTKKAEAFIESLEIEFTTVEVNHN